jgi:hypothetical protein
MKHDYDTEVAALVAAGFEPSRFSRNFRRTAAGWELHALVLHGVVDIAATPPNEYHSIKVLSSTTTEALAELREKLSAGIADRQALLDVLK